MKRIIYILMMLLFAGVLHRFGDSSHPATL